ncbi:MAG: DUF2232 domain-containing protein [Deltaproteobacteria bacterium]|nr:DUF2232 domain-containing protein [Deltaproteobacteria bacterium]MBW2067686.1 DUF2232 domain-containing protein [Deltaproteobacteria bacterium]
MEARSGSDRQCRGFPEVPFDMTQAGGWIVLSSALFGSAVWFPLVGVFLSLLTPIPSSLSVYQWGVPRGYAVPLGSFTLSILIFAIVGGFHALPYFAMFLIMGIVLGHCVRSFFSREFAVCLASGLTFVLGAVLFWYHHHSPEGSIFDRLEERTLQYLIEVLKEAGVTGVDRPYLYEQIKNTVHTVVRLLPGASLGSLLFAGAVNSVGIHRYSRRKSLPFPDWKDGILWRSPDWLVWPVILSGFAALFVPTVRVIVLNILIVLGVIYFLQGLSVTGFLAAKLALPPWLKVLGIILIITQQYLSLVVVFVGFFDVWFDFRKINMERRKT